MEWFERDFRSAILHEVVRFPESRYVPAISYRREGRARVNHSGSEPRLQACLRRSERRIVLGTGFLYDIFG